MKIYSSYGFNEFVVLLGYKGYYIKEYFANYFLHQSDVTIDMQTGKMEVLNNSSEPWKITLLDTGLKSMTGGRIKRAQEIVGNEPFMLTYGDGVSDINIDELVKFHKSHGKAITISSTQPDGRFGALNLNGDKVESFLEKPKGDGGWINIGYFVCEPKVFDYIIEGENTVFEKEPLINLTKDKEVCAFRHEGFWKPMDTLRDKISLQKLWETNSAPWKVW
jgi:glucose-1-phosphate cytidylyltransferase